MLDAKTAENWEDWDMKQTVHTSSELSGCATGCSELEEAQPARRASSEESPAALESLAQLELGGGAVQTVILLFKHLGSNPTVPSTNTEPHRGYSSLVAAQTSACLSRMAEFPRGQQTLCCSSPYRWKTAACSCLALPSSLLPLYPVPSMC